MFRLSDSCVVKTQVFLKKFTRTRTRAHPQSIFFQTSYVFKISFKINMAWTKKTI